MGFLRRQPPLHEQLAREGGLVEVDPRPAWQETGIHGIPRPRAADVTVTGEAAGIEANAVGWVTLPDGTLLVEDGPDSPLDALATAVEGRLPPPYRARAARQVDDVWAIQATRIEVLVLPDAREGDTFDLARNGDTATLSVDGTQVFGSLPPLAERGEREGRDYAVHAERLDGDLFEIRASPL